MIVHQIIQKWLNDLWTMINKSNRLLFGYSSPEFINLYSEDNPILGIDDTCYFGQWQSASHVQHPNDKVQYVKTLVLDKSTLNYVVTNPINKVVDVIFGMLYTSSSSYYPIGIYLNSGSMWFGICYGFTDLDCPNWQPMSRKISRLSARRWKMPWTWTFLELLRFKAFIVRRLYQR